MRSSSTPRCHSPLLLIVLHPCRVCDLVFQGLNPDLTCTRDAGWRMPNSNLCVSARGFRPSKISTTPPFMPCRGSWSGLESFILVEDVSPFLADWYLRKNIVVNADDPYLASTARGLP